jgi:hypothetical protein
MYLNTKIHLFPGRFSRATPDRRPLTGDTARAPPSTALNTLLLSEDAALGGRRRWGFQIKFLSSLFRRPGGPGCDLPSSHHHRSSRRWPHRSDRILPGPKVPPICAPDMGPLVAVFEGKLGLMAAAATRERPAGLESVRISWCLM